MSKRPDNAPLDYDAGGHSFTRCGWRETSDGKLEWFSERVPPEQAYTWPDEEEIMRRSNDLAVSAFERRVTVFACLGSGVAVIWFLWQVFKFVSARLAS